ncbi:MAG: dihydroorotase, partial [Nitrospirae bacterium]
DHAPHAPEEKARPFDDAPFGVVGLETCLAAVLELVRAGRLALPDLIERLTAGPARLFRLEAGSLAVGAAADVACFDPEESWVVEPERFHSKSRNTPWAGERLTGRVVHTLVGGRFVMRDREMLA